MHKLAKGKKYIEAKIQLLCPLKCTSQKSFCWNSTSIILHEEYLYVFK